MHVHTHTRLSYRQATAERATGSAPRPALPAQQGPRRSCHTLPPHHPPISARMRYRRAHCTTHATTPSSSRLASPNNIHTYPCTCLYTHAGLSIYICADTLMYISMYSLYLYLSVSLVLLISLSFQPLFLFMFLTLFSFLVPSSPLLSFPFLLFHPCVITQSLSLLFAEYMNIYIHTYKSIDDPAGFENIYIHTYKYIHTHIQICI